MIFIVSLLQYIFYVGVPVAEFWNGYWQHAFNSNVENLTLTNYTDIDFNNINASTSKVGNLTSFVNHTLFENFETAKNKMIPCSTNLIFYNDLIPL